jgi:two-component system, LuxR family, response regulator FixJ
MKAEPTVFVVDDDASIRRALARLLKSVGLAVELYAGAQEFLEACDPDRPGCLLLDVRMPGTGGLELQQILASRGAEWPIVFITGHGDVPMSVRAMKAGAVDFIPKPFSDQDLLDAVQRALGRDSELRTVRAQRAEVTRRIARLTPREREVFALVVAGKMNKHIAAQLGASEKTIKVHRGRVMEKMQADSVAELVVLAQAAGVYTTKVPSP